ncbi:MAG: hypothetical protein C0616_01865 [Desulfuromonas sp.]|nr:MAG: hypothetical protein C0616_01865 [Desulfuromonas sp.]
MAMLDSLNVICDSCHRSFQVSAKYLMIETERKNQDMLVVCDHCKRDEVLVVPLQQVHPFGT